MNRAELVKLFQETFQKLYTSKQLASLNEKYAYMYNHMREIVVDLGEKAGDLPFQFESMYEDEANTHAEFVSHLSPEQTRFYVWLQVNPNKEIQDEFDSQHDVVEEAEQLENSKFYVLFKEQA